MRKPRIGGSSGFSLNELLVVIGVISILATLLLPALAKSKARAQTIHCISNLHQMGLALHAYLADTQKYPSWPNWTLQLHREGLGISQETNYWERGVWRCPSAKMPQDPNPNYYGYNAFGVLRVGNLTNALGLLAAISTATVDSMVANPADMMAIGDSFTFSLAFMRTPLSNLMRHGNAFSRHEAKANVLFCDGHVESPTLKFLFEDTSDVALVRWNRDHLPYRERLNP